MQVGPGSARVASRLAGPRVAGRIPGSHFVAISDVGGPPSPLSRQNLSQGRDQVVDVPLTATVPLSPIRHAFPLKWSEPAEYAVVGRNLLGLVVDYRDMQVDSLFFSGAPSAGGRVAHLYAAPGQYIVSARVEDAV